MKKTALFRQLINAPEILQLPCCFDVLSAKVLEKAGFKAPDMIENYRHICNTLDLPVFVDIDTGFGDANNTR